MEVRIADALESACGDIHPEVAEALAQHDEVARLARQWGAIACVAYASQPERAKRFEWTEYGVTRLQRKLHSARVPLTPEAMGPYAITVMEVAATKLGIYYSGLNPSWYEAPMLPDVIDILLAFGKKRAKVLIQFLKDHAKHLAEFCLEQRIMPVTKWKVPYARLNHRHYVLSLLIDAAARMVRDGYRKQLFEIARKGDPVPLLQRVLGPHSRPFLEAVLRAECRQFDEGRYIVSTKETSTKRARRRARRAQQAQRSRARGHGKLVPASA